MKTSHIVKIFGLFLALGLLGLAGTMFVNPNYFTTSTQNKNDSLPPPPGQKYFQMYCASCHGLRGEGNGPTALNFARLPPNFLKKDSEFKNGFDRKGIEKTLKEGIPNSNMPTFNYLRADMKKELVDYLIELRRSGQ